MQTKTIPHTVKQIRDLHIGDKFSLAGSQVNVLMKHDYGKHTRLTLMWKDDVVSSVALPSTRKVHTKRDW